MKYLEFIQNIIATRGQWNIPDGEYFERHHILARCLGGKGDYKNGGFSRKSNHPNCIWLYPEEHFIAHKLLFEENPENYKLVTSYWLLIRKTNCATPEEYAIAKQQASKLTSLRNKNFIWTEELKTRISNKNKGKKMSKEAIAKSVESRKHNGTTRRSEETKEKIRQSHLALNFHHSDEARKLISEKAKGRISCNRQKVRCVELNKIFSHAKEAAEFLGKTSSGNNIRDCIRGKTKTAYGYHWEDVK